MLNDEERQRLDYLQQRELSGELDSTEDAELNQLVDRITADEKRYLPAATERIRQERLQLQTQNEAIRAVLRRQTRLAQRLERVIALSPR